MIVIDVEGHQLAVIKGMKGFLKTLSGVDVVIECEKSDKEVFEIMENLWYRVKMLDPYDWNFYK